MLETGEYGNNYNGLTDDDGQVTASFQSTGSHLTLSLKGYDVNYATEVQVLLNGDSIGFLTPGPNEQLNAGDTFILSATDQQAGENILTFQAENLSRWWGVTEILLEEGLPPADIALTLGELETGQYGNHYDGLVDNDGLVTASFQGTGSHLTLSLKGYDVNYATEVQVLLNGDSIGFLTPGPNEQLNAGDTFILSATDQQAGENILTFQAENLSRWWGVTEILLETQAAAMASTEPDAGKGTLDIADLIDTPHRLDGLGGDSGPTHGGGAVELGSGSAFSTVDFPGHRNARAHSDSDRGRPTRELCRVAAPVPPAGRRDSPVIGSRCLL